MKKILIALAVIVVLLVIGGFIFVSRLDGIVRSAVETNTTDSLDLKTTLASANVGLLSGDVGLDNLNIASPEGFTAPAMFSVGGLNVQTNYGKLLGDPVRVDAITIDKPKIVLEQKGLNFNFKVLADKFSGSGGDTTEPDTTEEPVKVIIDLLTVTNAEVEVRSELLSQPMGLKIPTFTLKNIGNADGAETGAELGRVVMEIVAKTAEQVAQNEDLNLPPEVRALLAGDLNAIKGQLQNVALEQLNKNLPDNVKNLLGDGGVEKLLNGKVPEDLGDNLKKNAESEIKNRLGGILGGKKDGKQEKSE